jgi:hypothetical protein
MIINYPDFSPDGILREHPQLGNPNASRGHVRPPMEEPPARSDQGKSKPI